MGPRPSIFSFVLGSYYHKAAAHQFWSKMEAAPALPASFSLSWHAYLESTCEGGKRIYQPANWGQVETLARWYILLACACSPRILRVHREAPGVLMIVLWGYRGRSLKLGRTIASSSDRLLIVLHQNRDIMLAWLLVYWVVTRCDSMRFNSPISCSAPLHLS